MTISFRYEEINWTDPLTALIIVIGLVIAGWVVAKVLRDVA